MSSVATHPEVRGLPVLETLPELQQALSGPGAAVLVAPPGAGKTTVVPLELLRADWVGEGRIIVLEPRRLATRAAADRMSRLLGEEGAGETVGYRIRGDTRRSRRTRIEVVTEGVLTRMLQSDPGLEGVAAILFDEFHERSLHADLGLALTLQSRSLFRPDLRLLVMSATLDAAPVAELLDGAPVVSSQGRAHPVKTRYRRDPVRGWIEPPTAATVLRALEEKEGDVLVFLPGAGEIRRTADRLKEAPLPKDVSLFPLFGSLSRSDQDRAIAPSPPGRRKVVLATSIAETSLTIQGIRIVVDSGRMRVPRFDPGTGMTRLETLRVTRDAADQRRGRAGRTAPGVCYRLWTRAEDRGLVPHRSPEILDADLVPLALELAVWGASPHQLRWLDPPPTAALAQAHELRRELEALDPEEGATEHGRALAGIGVHPRLAHMLLLGRNLGLSPLAADLAAILSDRDILRGQGRAPDADLRLRVEAMRRARSPGGGLPGSIRGHRIHGGGLKRGMRESDRLLQELGEPSAGPSPPDLARTGILTAMAYPDRIARRREGERGRFLLRNGRGARFGESQSLEGLDWLVAAEVEGRGRDARIFRAAPVSLGEIQEHFAEQMEENEEVRWDEEKGRVVARRRRMLGHLTVEEAPIPDPDPQRVARALLEGIRARGWEVLPWSRRTRQLQERLEFLGRHDPDRWPEASRKALMSSLEEWLLPFLAGMKRLDDLKKVDLARALLNWLGWDRQEALDRMAPTHLEVPSGSRILIDYSDPEAPTLAVRLQEVFGLTETPRIAGGRVPLTMTLLSPAQRPVQVTRDLESFWRDAYFQVRKDLRGRYPKHYWPDDPLEATPTRRTRPG